MSCPTVFKIGAIVSLASLVACGGNPTTDVPVQVKPGMYEAVMSGRGNSPFYTRAPNRLGKRTCVTAESAQFFPQKFTRTYLSMDGECSGPLSERVGNQVTGEVYCPFDGNRTKGRLTTAFVGTVSEQAVDVRAVTTLKISEGDPEKRAEIEATPLAKEGVELKVTIRRVGDC